MSVFGGLPEWPKGADCKSAGYAFDGSNPSPSTPNFPEFSIPELKTAPPSHLLHPPRNALVVAGVAQLLERQPSKLNVAGSNPFSRSADTYHPSFTEPDRRTSRGPGRPT